MVKWLEDAEDISALAKQYLRFHQPGGDVEKGEAERVAMRVDAWVTLGRPADAWLVIVEAIEMTDDLDTLAYIGASELEEIVRNHGPAFIDRIEDRYRESRRFRRALDGVGATTSPVWPRVQDLLGNAK